MEYLKIWTNFARVLEPLDDAERGRVFMAMLKYAETGEAPKFRGNERFIWPSAQLSIDTTKAEHDKKASSGAKGGKQTQANASKDKQAQAEPSNVKQDEAVLEGAEAEPSRKEKKRNEKKDISPGTGTTRTREDAFGDLNVDPVIVTIQQELTGLTGDHYEELEEFRKDLPDELIIEAVNEAVAHGTRFWSYVRAVLRRYIREGVRTVGDARDRRNQRDQYPRDRREAEGKGRSEYADLPGVINL